LYIISYFIKKMIFCKFLMYDLVELVENG